MENNEEIIVDGERIKLPKKITPEDMKDELLIGEEEFSDELEDISEIDWSKNE